MRRLLQYWQDIRYSLWFVPALIVALAILLAVLAITLDVHVASAALPSWPRVFVGSADGARGTLETIAGAMISIAALTFSITILVLSSVAAQYTPRVIRTFMGSTMTKTVLGALVGIYIYCLLVLRTVDARDPEFVPVIAVTIALVLALVGVGFLIAFIHHIASSIQLSSVAAAVADDTIASIERLYPKTVENADTESEPDEHKPEARDWHPLCADSLGYLQSMDTGSLARLAIEHGLVLRIEKSVGEFVRPGDPLLSSNTGLNEGLAGRIRGLFSVGRHRTVEQDPAVGIRQLADIALRALSPSTNDTTTAAICLDYLSAVLAALADRRLVSETDGPEARRRLLEHHPEFGAFLRLAFEQVRQHARNNLSIYLRLLAALQALAGTARIPERRAAIEHEARLVMTYARKNLQHADQQLQLEQAWQRTLRALRGETSAPVQNRPEDHGS